MELQEEIFINAPRDVVYAALNDPETVSYTHLTLPTTPYV